MRAVLLLLAGYSQRNVANGAAHALRRRGECASAAALLQQWKETVVLPGWRRVIPASCAGPNDKAIVQRALVQRDAHVQRSERAEWAQKHVGFIHPEKNRRIPGGGSVGTGRDKIVRFAV